MFNVIVTPNKVNDKRKYIKLDFIVIRKGTLNDNKEKIKGKMYFKIVILNPSAKIIIYKISIRIVRKKVFFSFK